MKLKRRLKWNMACYYQPLFCFFSKTLINLKNWSSDMFRWWNWALNPLLSYQKHLQTNLKRDQNDDELHNYDSKQHYTYIKFFFPTFKSGELVWLTPLAHSSVFHGSVWVGVKYISDIDCLESFQCRRKVHVFVSTFSTNDVLSTCWLIGGCFVHGQTDGLLHHRLTICWNE